MKRRPWRRRASAERRMNCLRVARVLQSYLDGEIDEVTARRVSAHLEVCRRCGLEASVYREIHHALARRAEPDSGAVERLHAFGTALLSDPPTGGDDTEHGPTPPAGA